MDIGLTLLLLVVVAVIVIFALVASHLYSQKKEAPRKLPLTFFRGSPVVHVEQMEEVLPRILQHAKVIMVEKWLVMKTPIAYQGRVDEVYRIASGELLLLDTKSRAVPKVYQKDLVGVSCYAYMLRQRGEKVLPWAFFRLHTKSGVFYARVPLIPDVDLIALMERARELDLGLRTPTGCGQPAFCQNCGFEKECNRIKKAA